MVAPSEPLLLTKEAMKDSRLRGLFRCHLSTISIPCYGRSVIRMFPSLSHSFPSGRVGMNPSQAFSPFAVPAGHDHLHLTFHRADLQS
jgi:hypothetical protein